MNPGGNRRSNENGTGPEKENLVAANVAGRMNLCCWKKKSVDTPKPKEMDEIPHCFTEKIDVDAEGNTELHRKIKDSKENDIVKYLNFKEESSTWTDEDEKWCNCIKKLVYRKNKSGNTPLEIALKKGFLNAMDAMLNHIRHYPTKLTANQPSNSPPEDLIERDLLRDHAINEELEKSKKANKELLHSAVKLGNVEVVEKLLKLGFDPMMKGDNKHKGKTPLHVAARLNSSEIAKTFFKHGEANIGDVDTRSAIACKLLRSEEDKEGFTPLLLAARWGCWEIAKELLQAGADAKMDPLELLKGRQSSTKKRQNIFDNLIEHQKNANFLERLLLYFKAREEFATLNNYLKDNPMVIIHAAKHGSNQGTRILIGGGVKLDVKDKDDQTPIHWAAKGGHHDVIDNLFKDPIATSIINSRDSWGNTALHYAAKKGHSEICHDLIKNGADVKSLNDDHLTPFELAILEARLDSVEVFCKVCDLDKHFHTGLAPLHLAAQLGHASIVAMLLREGATIESLTKKPGEKEEEEDAEDGVKEDKGKKEESEEKGEKGQKANLAKEGETEQGDEKRRKDNVAKEVKKESGVAKKKEKANVAKGKKGQIDEEEGGNVEEKENVKDKKKSEEPQQNAFEIALDCKKNKGCQTIIDG